MLSRATTSSSASSSTTQQRATRQSPSKPTSSSSSPRKATTSSTNVKKPSSSPSKQPPTKPLATKMASPRTTSASSLASTKSSTSSISTLKTKRPSITSKSTTASTKNPIIKPAQPGGASFELVCRRNVPSYKQLSQAELLDHIENVSHIRLDREKLTRFDPVDYLPNITHLYLQHNDLTSFDHASAFPKLEFLILANNKLTTVPDFTQCPNLQLLDLSHNYIPICDVTMLPPNVTYLFLKGNPCAMGPAYRLDVIKALEDVEELDGVEVTDFERRLANGGNRFEDFGNGDDTYNDDDCDDNNSMMKGIEQNNGASLSAPVLGDAHVSSSLPPLPFKPRKQGVKPSFADTEDKQPEEMEVEKDSQYFLTKLHDLDVMVDDMIVKSRGDLSVALDEYLLKIGRLKNVFVDSRPGSRVVARRPEGDC